MSAIGLGSSEKVNWGEAVLGIAVLAGAAAAVRWLHRRRREQHQRVRHQMRDHLDHLEEAVRGGPFRRNQSFTKLEPGYEMGYSTHTISVSSPWIFIHRVSQELSLEELNLLRRRAGVQELTAEIWRRTLIEIKCIVCFKHAQRCIAYGSYVTSGTRVYIADLHVDPEFRAAGGERELKSRLQVEIEGSDLGLPLPPELQLDDPTPLEGQQKIGEPREGNP